jgi:hypothetical protein
VACEILANADRILSDAWQGMVTDCRCPTLAGTAAISSAQWATAINLGETQGVSGFHGVFSFFSVIKELGLRSICSPTRHRPSVPLSESARCPRDRFGAGAAPFQFLQRALAVPRVDLGHDHRLIAASLDGVSAAAGGRTPVAINPAGTLVLWTECVAKPPGDSDRYSHRYLKRLPTGGWLPAAWSENVGC